MKVGIVSEKYHPYVSGGAERSLQILAEGLADSRIEPVVISLRPDPGHGVDRVNGVKVHYVGLENFYWPFDGKSRPSLMHYLFHARSAMSAAMARKVGALLDVERPDLVHTNNLAGFGVRTWRAAKSRRIPIVHTLRDYYLMCPFSSMFRRGKNCEAACARCVPFRAAFRRASGTVDGVAGNSRFILQRHVGAGFFTEAPQRKVIYNASGAGISPDARPNPGKVVTFGFLGRIVPEKGLELILGSLTGLDLGNWRIDMAGSGDERYHAYLEDRFRDERIRWLGWTEPNAVYRSVDYVVLPSLWHEPLSRTVLEAFSHGIPVIASRRGGNTELIREGVNGFLFDPERPESLAAVLRKALQCDVRLPELSRACLQDAQSFTEDRLVHEYADLYAAVCRTKPLLPSMGDG